ncbi:hypothetical protein UFOVP56_79 [uncultured Caudovirales phage]|uniref:Uncharacterized protein n=1 Tax=uncultured Caudovirales phage TaxID=2100421 RepID=A0A6J5T8L1_9CAUD|nr:hypothetical protein UFOVP56_79 [uncultured Caudovirales phage]
MATTPGLDPSNINLYGAAPADTEEYQKALQASVSALEQRYANPNWFNVAAGFLKPQLGGFAASLGSAGQAMGENLEKQRESQLPIAQMRAQLAASKIAMGQKSAASELVAGHKGPVTEELLKQVIARTGADSPVAQGIKEQLAGERANQGLLSQQQTLRQAQGSQALQLAQQQFSSGAISREEYQRQLADIKGTYSPTQPVTPTRPVGAPGATLQTEAAPVTGNYGKESNLRGLADTGGIPFDPVTEIEAINAALPSLRGADRENALKSKAELEAKGTNSASSNAPKTPAKKEIIAPVFGKESGLTPEQLASAIKPQEELAQVRYKGLQDVGADENYKPLERAITNQMDLIKNNKEAAGRVSAVLSKGGPGNAFLAAINEGVGLSVNGLSGNVRAPVETFIRASFKPEDQDLAMAMAQNYAAIALAKQKMGNVNPNSARNSELGLYAGLTPSMHTTPNASLKALAHFKQDLGLSKAQYDYATDLLFNRHPTQTLSPDDPARYSSALNNPGYAKLYEPFGAKHKAIDTAFQRSLEPKSPKP